MEQTDSPGGPGLPCTHEQALALYQRLFRCPASLGQLWAVLRHGRLGVHSLPQGQEGWGCPQWLELTTVLLEMERRRQAREQLLWDLELLTGAGLGLLWPPWAQVYGLRSQVQGVPSQHDKLCGRTGGDSEWPLSGTGDSLNQDHQLPEGAQADSLSASSGLDEVGSHVDPSEESLGTPAGPTPGCLQDQDLTTSRTFGELRHSELKHLAQPEVRTQIEPQAQRLHLPASRRLQGKELAQGVQESSGLSGAQHPPEGLVQEREEFEKLLTDTPQGQRKEEPQDQKKRFSQSPRGETSLGENKEISQSPRKKTQRGQRGETSEGDRGSSPKCQKKEAPQGQETKTPPSTEGDVPRAWEVTMGEAPTQLREDSLGSPRKVCGSRGEQIPQPGVRERRGPKRKTNRQSRESVPAVGKPRAPHLLGPAARSRLPGAAMLEVPSTGDYGQQKPPAPCPRAPGLRRGPLGLQALERDPGRTECEAGEVRVLPTGGPAGPPGTFGERWDAAQVPKPSKALWSEPQGSEAAAAAGVSKVQRETALQRLMELHGVARRRLRQEQERQRLRVLERLNFARNRQSRVHPLGPPFSPAQFPSQTPPEEGHPRGGRRRSGLGSTQEDATGHRRALREQLLQVHRERTGRLRAFGARNTQNFQELLWPPGAEVPASGERGSPSAGLSSLLDPPGGD